MHFSCCQNNFEFTCVCSFFNGFYSGTKPENLEPTDKSLELNKLVEETQKLKAVVDELQKSKVKTENEMINLKLNLDEAKNENSIVLQVSRHFCLSFLPNAPMCKCTFSQRLRVDVFYKL